jgi:Polyketide cyclase / dehydrase and lipid transport
MARSAHAQRVVPLAPEAALRLWADSERWPSFVEGFARVVERSGDWPHEGAKIVWESTPEGRGRVTETVVVQSSGAFVSHVYDKSINGRQALRVLEDAEGSRVELSLDYELSKSGPLAGVTDLLFIRRALRDSLNRTLRRFAVEAEEEAGLR